LVGLAIAATPAPSPVSPQVPVPPLQQIGPGDQIRIDVFGNPDLATAISVNDDGTIRMPLAGVVAVGGQSPADAARRIEAALKTGEFLVNPQVTVTLVQSFSERASVLGEVRAPGRYPIMSNSTVLDLIALAGGITEKGADIIYIMRKDASGALQRLPVSMSSILTAQSANSAPIPVLQVGDSVVVPKGTYFITGQVTKPGEYRIEGDMILFEAIAHAGGVTPLGSASRVEVRRRGPDDRVIDVKKVSKNMRIEPGDVIRVKERLF
ncbi:MAG: polysaccharide biosynthesis/export family protein, partial [Pseudomonadota bacterium]